MLSNGMTTYLEIILNGADTGRVEPVIMREGHFFMQATTLRRLGLGTHIPQDRTELVELSRLEIERVRYESATQQLLLDVPPAWLPKQVIASSGRIAKETARASLGAIVNYDAYASQTGNTTNLSLWNEARLFGRFGTLSTTGVAQTGELGGARVTVRSKPYQRYDTSWSYSDQKHVLTAQAGDLVTKALSWSNTVRLGGLQISRDFAVRPDIITYPLPQFAGQASVPTSVDLLINGVQTMHESLQPGPYSLTNFPSINGAGEATVVTTDVLGRRTEASVPFYVASTLLHPGYTDYTVSLGAQRRRYGLADFDYGPLNVDASYRRGIFPWLTVESHAEAAPHLALGGLGALTQLGQKFGLFDIAATTSYRPRNFSQTGEERLPTQGRQAVIGYQYTRKYLTLTAQKIWRSKGFADLSTYEPGFVRLSRQSLQACGSLTLPHLGSVSLGYFDVTPATGRRTRFATIGDTLPLWRGLSLSLLANRQLGTSSGHGDGWTGYAQLVIPFGRLGTATAGWSRQADGSSVEQVSASHSVSPGGGIGWEANYQRTGAKTPDSVQASVTWRGRVIQMQGGVFGPLNKTIRWAEAQGSIATMDGAVFAGNRVPDAFAVISTDGVAGVPVRYENQIIGKTGAGGHLLIPYATSYYPAKYEIDTLSLPSDLQAGAVEQRVAIQYGSGYLVHFPMRHAAPAILYLRDEGGKSLPVGTAVRAGRNIAYIGWGGMLYLPELTKAQRLSATLPSGIQCSAVIDRLPPATNGQRLVGDLTCRQSP